MAEGAKLDREANQQVKKGMRKAKETWIEQQCQGIKENKSAQEGAQLSKFAILQHQQNLYYVFMDFKKVFDRVWHAALWATMRLHNINDNLIRTIGCLYDKVISTVYHDNLVEWLQTTIGVLQGCLLSPTLFNIFLQRIVAEALDDHKRM